MIYLKLERRRPIKLEMRGSHYEEEKRKNFVFVLLLLLCLIIPFSSILAFAYVPSGHIFSDGSPVGYYYVNNSVGNAPCGVSYTNLINDAAAGWNNSGACLLYTSTAG